MKEYIEREAALNAVRKVFNPSIARMAQAVVALQGVPAADVREVKPEHWISVEERLPEDGEEVLCYYEYFRYGSFNRMYKTIDRGYFLNGHFGGEPSNGRKARVLYWMPLPEPPKEEM